jgi:rhomboid family GlyGly-CTERM serine protease
MTLTALRHSLPHSLRPYLLPLALALCVTLVALGGSVASDLLRYDRAALMQGQWWRLLSGHLVHLGWSHLALNLAGLALVWALVGDRLSTLRWLVVITASALGISVGLLAFHPELAWYVGLSGILHALLVAGSLAALRSGDGRAALLLILVWAKLIWEQLAGPLPGSVASAGGAVIVDAHFYGGLVGTLCGGLLRPQPTQSSND